LLVNFNDQRYHMQLNTIKVIMQQQYIEACKQHMQNHCQWFDQSNFFFPNIKVAMI